MFVRASQGGGGGGEIKVDDTTYTSLPAGYTTLTFNSMTKLESIMVWYSSSVFSYGYKDENDSDVIKSGVNLYLQSISGNQAVVRSLLSGTYNVEVIAIGK